MHLYQSSHLLTPLSEQHFELSYWVNMPQSSCLTGGRGAGQKIMIDGQAYVLRRYLRGGLMAKLSYDAYIWLGKHQSRPYQEQQVMDYARQKKLPVPACAAYCINQSGLLYRAAIITEFLPNDGTLASYLETHELSAKDWEALALVINNMHRALINHADLNANNILVHHINSSELSFSLIDFDKAKIEKNSNDWPLNNVNRLHRSLLKLNPQYFTKATWALFLEAYHQLTD